MIVQHRFEKVKGVEHLIHMVQLVQEEKMAMAKLPRSHRVHPRSFVLQNEEVTCVSTFLPRLHGKLTGTVGSTCSMSESSPQTNLNCKHRQLTQQSLWSNNSWILSASWQNLIRVNVNSAHFAVKSINIQKGTALTWGQ